MRDTITLGIWAGYYRCRLGDAVAPLQKDGEPSERWAAFIPMGTDTAMTDAPEPRAGAARSTATRRTWEHVNARGSD
jgi:hypothetical protein